MRIEMKKWSMILLVAWVVASIGSSLMHSNPPVTHTVQWDSPKTKELFSKVCADCHSNETKWPWYSYIAPVSFVINYHVQEGREHFNVSNNILKEAHEAAEEYEEGKMPESGYLQFHPEAQLSSEDREALITGLKATFGTKSPKNQEKPKEEGHHE